MEIGMTKSMVEHSTLIFIGPYDPSAIYFKLDNAFYLVYETKLWGIQMYMFVDLRYRSCFHFSSGYFLLYSVNAGRKLLPVLRFCGSSNTYLHSYVHTGFLHIYEIGACLRNLHTKIKTCHLNVRPA